MASVISSYHRLAEGHEIAARYAFTVVAVALASLLRGVLVPALGEGVPFILYFPTVVLCAWFGGLWPGLLSAVLGGFVALYFFIPPYQSFTAHDPTAPAQLIVFLVASTLISLLADRLHWATRRAQDGEARERNEREKIRVTLTSVGDAVIVTDDRGRVTLMNGVAESLTGWREADAIGRPLADVFTILNEQSRRPVGNPIARVLREGQITGLANHTVLVSEDGREIPIDDSAAPIRDVAGTLLGAVLVFRDISERRQIERERAILLDQERTARAEIERLAARQRHLQSVTDTALSPRALDDFVPELLGRLRVAMASDTATLLLLAEDGLHLTPFYSVGLRDDLRADVRIPLGHGVAGRIALSDHGLIIDDLTTVEVVRPILVERVKSLVGAPLKIGGRLLGIVHAGAAERRRFTDDDLNLLRLVADRTALAIERTRLDEAERGARVDADRQRGEAEATNRTKDQFLAVLSHELRQPLNTMLGWLSVLRSHCVDPVQQDRALDAIERNTRAQARMIDDLLDIARIEAGKLALERRAVSLGPLIAETVESLQHEAKAKALTLGTQLDPAASLVSADADRLRQVLVNLLANAIKYTPAGGRVHVRLTAAEGVVRVVVSDTGIGIEPDLLAHVFERFRQADDARLAGPQGGLGLGLAIVREIVEMHGGAVEAQSDGRGRGATFMITLPMIAG
jgi:PAS domain S-box-containing protein